MRRSARFAALGSLVALAYLGGTLNFVERQLHDARAQLTTRAATGDVVVVAIDSNSLSRLGTWPWPRRYYADAIEHLLAAGATAIALDVDFSSVSHPEDDARLQAAMAAAGPERIALPVFRQVQRQPDGTIEFIDTGLRQHASLAHANFRPDPDGLIRRVQATAPRESIELPALAVWLDPGGAAPNPIVIDFSIDPSSVPRLSFADVLEGTFEPAMVVGKRVILGVTADELGDPASVPRYRLLPGPLIHALAFETLRQGRALREIGGFPIALWTVVLAWGCGLMASRLQLTRGALILTGCSSAIVLGACLLQASAAISLHISPLLAGLLSSFVDALIQIARRQDNLLRGVVNNSFDAIITFDRKRRVTSCNRAAERLFHCSAQVSKGLRLSLFLPGDNGKDALEQVAASDHGPYELLAQGPRNRQFPVEVAYSTMQLQGEWVGIAAIRDITERKVQAAKLTHLALHDPLTGLVNRSVLQERMIQAVAAARQSRQCLALLLLDLDHFKEVNDTLGHQIGDELLQQIGPRLQAYLRETDTLARLGGDEFAILVPEIADLRAGCVIAERIVEALSQPFAIGGLRVEIGVSIGIAGFPEHAVEPSELLQRADVAMYTSKRNRLGFAIYDPQEDIHSVRRLTLQGELRHAIYAHQLALYYQPKIDASSAKLVGFEALARWPHPEHGMIRPEEFIPAAEHSGLIMPLTVWALEAALREQQSWRKCGLRLSVAVNISVKSLQDVTFPAQVRELLQRFQGTPEELHLEITESALMADPGTALTVLTDLARVGCRLSLDDFGTGYSSLAYLQKLPIHEFKIDRSFVLAMEGDESAAVIVRSIINLGHSLGLSVVAEGVEDQTAFDTLRRLGCDLVQGYFLGRPMEANAVDAWLTGTPWARALQPWQVGAKDPSIETLVTASVVRDAV
jgi:diguanylate cyclase (GGDEF)-like protein/PAS domain S-box-containing protein